MALKSNFNSEFSKKELEEKAKQIHERIIMAMHMAGERFIIASREQIQDHSAGTYLDQTTNLRNSIQYLIFHNGEVIEESPSDNASGNRSSVQELVKAFGYQLIGVAGMNYASYVESKGYNVISNQKDTCIVDLTEYFKDIQHYIDNE